MENTDSLALPGLLRPPGNQRPDRALSAAGLRLGQRHPVRLPIASLSNAGRHPGLDVRRQRAGIGRFNNRDAPISALYRHGRRLSGPTAAASDFKQIAIDGRDRSDVGCQSNYVSCVTGSNGRPRAGASLNRR